MAHLKDFIIEKLENEATDSDLFWWWNEYDSEVNIGDNQIFTSLEEWAEILGDDAVTFARRVFHGNVQSWHDDYFWLNGYANFESSHSLTADQSPICFSELAEWLIDENPRYIREWIDEWEDQNG